MTDVLTEQQQTNDKGCPRCHRIQQLALDEIIFCTHCRFPMALIHGKYRCTKELGEGGFGTVYLAEGPQPDSAHPTLYVLKVLKPETLQIPGMDKRFQREIRLTQQLSENNEHIVKLIDYGEEPGIGHFYVMEHLQGKELFVRLRGKTPLTYKEIFHIFRQLCEGMAIAHRMGVIHRDLKPSNVFLVSKGQDPLFVKIIDFGIAKPLEGTANPELTKGMLGTPHYMPPEQCANKAIDQRSDIYAMGAILFEMLTGRPPFSGDLSDILLQKMTREPPSIIAMQPERDFPEGLDQAILKAMAKEPQKRFHTAAAFWKALAPHTQGFDEQELMLDGRTIDWDELDNDSFAIDDTGAFGWGVQSDDTAVALPDTITSGATTSSESSDVGALGRAAQDDAYAATMATPLPQTQAADLRASSASPSTQENVASEQPPQAKIILSDSFATDQPSSEPSQEPSHSARRLDPAVVVAIIVAVLLIAAVVALLLRR